MRGFDRVQEACEWLRPRVRPVPEVAVVLGSGLGGFADALADATVVPYGEIPHWPASQVVGHAGRLTVGAVGRRRVIALAGRVHAYEGHDLRTVTFAVRVLGALGVKTLVLTNAAGGVNTDFRAGDLMLIDDHLNLTGGNPLVGPNDQRFGPRFPDMTEVYSRRLRVLALEVGSALDEPLVHGVYAGLLGPSYETPAEIRCLRAIGADSVGMSTVHEAIVARHMGLEVLGLSCITNMAAGVLPEPLRHEEVMETAERVKGRFVRLIEGIVARA